MNPIALADAAAPGQPGNPAAAKRASMQAAKWMAAAMGRGLNQLCGSRAQGRFGILMYHRVAREVPGVAPPTWNVTPQTFRAQIAGLLKRGFAAWPLERLIHCHRQGGGVPEGTFAVTFDDGHESVYKYAWPILRELGIPATLFLPTAYIDGQGPFPFDDWSLAGSDRVPSDSWRPMTEAQVRAMTADGLVKLGAHTHAHRDLTSRPGDFDRDLAETLDILRSRFDVLDPPFAFPFGRVTAPTMAMLRQRRVSCGLTMAAFLIDPRDTPFGWGRFHVEPWDTAGTLEAKLSGWYSWLPRMGRQLTGRCRGKRIYE